STSAAATQALAVLDQLSKVMPSPRAAPRPCRFMVRSFRWARLPAQFFAFAPLVVLLPDPDAVRMVEHGRRIALPGQAQATRRERLVSAWFRGYQLGFR